MRGWSVLGIMPLMGSVVFGCSLLMARWIDSMLMHFSLYILIKDIGRQLPLQLQCSYQGQQGDFSHI